MANDKAKPTTAKVFDGYLVTVKGEYYCRVEGDSMIDTKPFEEEVKMTSMVKALSSIRNKYLPRVIPKKDSRFMSVRLCSIISVRASGSASTSVLSPDEMDREMLVDYIQEKGLPITPKNFSDLLELRRVVGIAEEKSPGFKERIEKLEEEATDHEELLALNPEMA